MQRLGSLLILRTLSQKPPGKYLVLLSTWVRQPLQAATRCQTICTDFLPPSSSYIVRNCKRTCSNAASQVHKEPKSPSEEHTHTILQRLHGLEESLRVRGYSTLRWGLAVLLVTGFGIYIFREPLRENVADEVADVASRSLGKVEGQSGFVVVA